MMEPDMSTAPLWTPSPERIAKSEMRAFAREAGRLGGRNFESYDALWQWSVDEAEAFWSLVWDDSGVIGDKGPAPWLADGDRMPGALWFPEGRLNYAENLLRHCEAADIGDALVFWGETKVKRHLSRGELRAQVAGCRAALKEIGVGAGDRVAGYLPNMPETLVAMLATASLGAIWTSASPDFGVQGVLDRFGQTAPRVLFVADGYWYNGKAVDCIAKNAEIVAQLPSVECCVVIPYLDPSAHIGDIRVSIRYAEFLAKGEGTPLEFERVPFNHPLFIMYSSGTTGVPKCIVHGHGGTLLQHLKEHRLHGGIGAGSRLFYFTTCGWMMWNWLCSGLATGAVLLIFDGSPFAARGTVLFDYAEQEGATHFGTSAKYLDAAAKMGLEPIRTHRLDALQVIFSTGSPLAPEGFDYVYSKIKSDVLLASISGGTDILSCFVLGNPTLPVWRGEIQCRGLGMAVEAYDEDGRPLRGGKGELVCTRPFPSMPVGFWNDADGSKYRNAYFEVYKNVWHHGDFVEITVHGGMIIYGRSDATLNPGGVRIGTAEIYRQVEQVPEVLESRGIGQDWPPDSIGDVRVVLFVKLREGTHLDKALADRIKKHIRDNTTPRHVPAVVLQVADIPRTKSGKIVELAVRNVVHDRPVKNLEALANPEALEHFRGRAELRS
jgi:acetoacetyl-CoA synthetase